MSKKELYPHQVELFNDILIKLKTVDRLCVQASTGFGKTVIFTELAKYLNDYVLILVDSEDLIKQTFETFKSMDLDVCTFESKNKIFPMSKIVISMAQTLSNRLNKKPTLCQHFNYLIVDEAHVYTPNKIFSFLKNCKIIGFTATPIRLKRIKYFNCNSCGKEKEFVKESNPNCCGYDMQVWSKEETMNDVYQDICVGAGIDFLIENNYLVDEELYTIDIDSSNLVKDVSGEFTKESVAKVYEDEKVQIDILHNYLEYCKDKKTMIFTANTKINAIIYEMFINENIPVKLYDSVNSNKKERQPIVKWFKETKGAVLLNVSCFTKGFDVKTVEAIILARPTASLSLFIQIAGRGARTTDEFYKDKFIFIDGGGNSDRLGMWSDSTRDWNKLFFNGLKPPKQIKDQLEDTKECKNCSALIPKSEKICEYCEHDQFESIEEEENEEEEFTQNKILAVQKKIIYPKGEKIITYCKSKSLDINFAFKILINQTFDLFIKTKTTFGNYQNSVIKGNFDKRINRIMGEPFIKIINSMESKSLRTLKYLKTKLIEKLELYYGNKI